MCRCAISGDASSCVGYDRRVRGGVSGAAAAAALAVSLAAAAPLPAHAHDSRAPPGAPHVWLPHERWVARHWIPFDLRRLQRSLGLAPRDFYAFVFNDHRTLARLARSRGIDVGQLADHLVAPWRATVDDERVAVLRARTLRLLTQGHLAQHVFFHLFHTPGIKSAAVKVLRLSLARLRRLRARGLSVLDIARLRGVAPGALRRGILRAFRKHRDDGVRLQQALPTQAARVLAEQATLLPCWTRRPLPAQDDGNPFGKAMREHGAHTAAWPSTARQWRADERRVERVRRSLTRSCWPRPRGWSWSAAGLPGGRSAGSTLRSMTGQESWREPTLRATPGRRASVIACINATRLDDCLNGLTKTAATAAKAPIKRGRARAHRSRGAATTRLHCRA
jgi:hypothetical protein